MSVFSQMSSFSHTGVFFTCALRSVLHYIAGNLQGSSEEGGLFLDG